MKSIIIILIFVFLALVSAFPQDKKFNFNPGPPNPNDKRFEITHLQGGGSRGQGFDVAAGARAKLWESNNGNHQVHGSGTYSQHLGGPYGNSRPNVGGGIGYTYKFGKK